MRNRSAIFRHAADEWKAMRAEFELVLESVYARMERDTNGVMLNADGKREPITAWSLMTGPAWRVERYGSPELREWVRIHGRPSVERFEAEWFANRYASQVELGPDSGGNAERIRELVASAAKLDTVRVLSPRVCVECGRPASATVEETSGRVLELCADHFRTWLAAQYDDDAWRPDQAIMDGVEL